MSEVRRYPIVAIFLIGMIMNASCNQQGNANHQVAQKQKAIGTKVAALDLAAALVYHDKKGNYWFGSREKGVYKYDGSTLILFTADDGLCGQAILSVQEDALGNVYFDTPSGVCKYDGQKFTDLPIAETDPATHEWKSDPNDLWFRMGWEHNGPFRYDGEKLYPLLFPKTSISTLFEKNHPNISYNPYGIYSLFVDSKSNIWFGTSNVGIYMFDGKEVRWMYEKQLTETPAGGAFGIRSMAEDLEGYYWFCNVNYKYTLLPNNKEETAFGSMNLKRQLGMPNRSDLYFLSMLRDNEGNFWMLTYEEGVWRSNGKDMEQFFIPVGGRNVAPTSMCKDQEGNIWFGTASDGIYKLNGNTFEKFDL